ncbi:hypothetical protein MEX01_51800 [Methylorubrum extorquens]|uniref:hypothetical protein n=1 Tax=Methylorubrum extorquens TaxID=408 RepID=UPI001171479A|nr:hypothetical protein [Methylorubrum extorquens]GEL44589.1 hypothetical protein MEX01_51800 [Methylorubrum extorquens]
MLPNGPKTEQDFREFYEGALAYLGLLVGEIVGADANLVVRADQHMQEIRAGGLSPFLQPMQQKGASWARNIAVLKVDERREAAEKSGSAAGNG